MDKATYLGAKQKEKEAALEKAQGRVVAGGTQGQFRELRRLTPTPTPNPSPAA